MDALNDWLFAPPIWAPFALAASAVAALLVGLTRGNKTARNGGMVLVVAAAGWMAASALVDTWPEAAEKQARELVDAYDKADWPAMRQLVDRDTRLENLAGDTLVLAAQLTHENLGHKELDMKQVTAEKDLAGVRVQFNVTSFQNAETSRVTTAWQFDYVVRDGKLMLKTIEPLTSLLVDADTIRGRIVRP